MKKLLSIILIAAFGLMVACTGKVEKEIKIVKNDSCTGKEISMKIGSCMHMGDSCKMKCCDEKVCDSLCQELSKVICKIVELKVKQSMCMMKASCHEKEGSAAAGCKEPCDKKCDEKCPHAMKKAVESKDKK